MNHQQETQLLYAYFIQYSGYESDVPVSINADKNKCFSDAVARFLVIQANDANDCDLEVSQLVCKSTTDVDQANNMKRIIDDYFKKLGV